MIVREARNEDLAECVSFGRKFWEMTEYSQWFDYDEDSIETICSIMLENNTMVVVEDNGEIVGAAGGYVSPWPFNLNVNAGSELFWYVDDGYRNSGIGKEMMALLEQLAKKAGATVWSMMCLDAVEPEKATAMYKKAGYTPTERTFTKVI